METQTRTTNLKPHQVQFNNLGYTNHMHVDIDPYTCNTSETLTVENVVMFPTKDASET